MPSRNIFGFARVGADARAWLLLLALTVTAVCGDVRETRTLLQVGRGTPSNADASPGQTPGAETNQEPFDANVFLAPGIAVSENTEQPTPLGFNRESILPGLPGEPGSRLPAVTGDPTLSTQPGRARLPGQPRSTVPLGAGAATPDTAPPVLGAPGANLGGRRSPQISPLGVDLGSLPGSGRQAPALGQPVVGGRLIPLGLDCDIRDTKDSCPDGMVCGPGPNRKKKFEGLCSIPPIGGVVLPIPKGKKTDAPLPVAYFPLNNKALVSWPDTVVKGAIRGATFRHDPEFGAVLHCKQDANDVVVLQSVEYGTKGAFSINLWMKKDSSTSYLGSGHQYIFSHTSEDNANASKFSPTVPNQVNLYLPEISAPAHGLVRALVMDSNDGNRTLEDGFPFLDSDGSFENNELRNVTDHVELEDGQWHMITVTTKPRGAKGIVLYVDGELAGETPDVRGVGGGDPMEIDGNIFLCGRVDGNPDRHFDGSLAKLSLYDEVLTPVEIEALYTLVFGSTATEEVLEEGTADKENKTSLIQEDLRVVEDAKSGLRFVRRQERDFALQRLVSLGAEIKLLDKITVDGLVNDTTLCVTNPEDVGIDEDDAKEQCRTGEVCAPIHQRLLALLYKNSKLPDDDKLFLNGACAARSKGGISGAQADNELPTPLSYFPLTGGSVKSWPVANAQGVTVNVDVVKDRVFGSVFRCNQGEGSFIVLDNVPYGEKGSFSINLWFRPLNVTGNAFQYMFSHSGAVPTADAWQPNQVQIYLAETNHSAGGVVRSIVLDSNDGGRGPQAQVYMDSDGDVARTVKNEDAVSAVDIMDKGWHMVTLSTRPDLKKGYSMYLDGKLAAEMEEGQIYTGDDEIPREPTAGGPLRPGGKIYMCGRHDGRATRHFDGDLAQLGLYDRALSQEEVATLYSTSTTKEPSLKSKNPPAKKKKPTKPSKTESTSTQAATTPEPGAPTTSGVSDLDKKKRKLFQATQVTQGQPLPAGLDASGVSALEPVEVPPEAAAAAASPTLPKGSYIGELTGKDGQLYGGCTGNTAVDPISCERGLTCMRVLTFAAEPNPDNRISDVGMCAPMPLNAAYVFDPTHNIELPVAYFPLTGDIVNSWPFPTFNGLPSGEAEFVDDDVFGSVLSCRQDNQDQLVLDPVDYAATGGFTINFWLRKRPHHSSEGKGYQFVFSHNNASGYQGIKGQSQVQIYFPEDAHQLYGLIRAVVRDSNDLDDGTEESLSFLDSDGIFADNANRTLPPQMVNFTDDQWHMVTLTTHEENEPGYSIFLDGVLAADVKPGPGINGQVTGGDPITLDGPIYLCGRSDEAAERHFDGTLAHLAMWNMVLSKQEIFVLYERMILAAIGIQKPHPNRETVGGEDCFFPGILRGKLIQDCTELEGVLKCPTRDGIWTECKPFNDEIIPLTVDVEPVERFTIDGEKCELPTTYNNKQVFDCIAINGKEPRCQVVGKPGAWEICANAKDSPESAFQGFETERPPPTIAAGRIVSRVTVDGKTCVFPFWHKGKSVADCVDIGGAMQCQVASGELAQCAEMIYTKTGTPCAFPFTDENEPSKPITACVEKDGNDMCKNAEGFWEECGGEPAVTNTFPLLLPGRVTVDKEQCAFPFWYKGKLVASCVDMSGEAGITGSGFRCRDENGVFNECAPIRGTVTGNQCAFPFVHDGEQAYDCINVDGTEQCMVIDGSFEECSPATKNFFGTKDNPGLPEAAIRFTLSGEECIFPFMYNGKVQNDCVEIDGIESCKTATDIWDECATEDTVEVVKRISVNGEDCVMPFVLEGRLNTDCFEQDGTEVCRVSDEIVECAPLESNPETEQKTVELPMQRMTVNGDHCRFPFTYNGELWVDCTSLNGVEICKDSEGQWQECEPESEGEEVTVSLTKSKRQTVDGDDCVFPLTYNGADVNDCVEIDGIESCKNAKGAWEECEPLPRGAAKQSDASEENGTDDVTSERKTVNGNFCAFPFDYQGEQVSACIRIDSIESCKNSDGDWEECIIPRASVDGELCDFPFDYNGERMVECVDLEGIQSCKVSSGKWAECAQDRSTVTGIQCRFPFPYQGETMTQCVEVDGVERCQSINGTWEACVPHPEKPIEERLSVSGKVCQFPYTHKGKVHRSCFKHKKTHVCNVGDGVLEECAKRGQENNAVNLQSEVVLEEQSGATESKKRHHHHHRSTKKKDKGLNAASIGMIVAVTVAAFGLLVTIAAVFLYRRKKKGASFDEKSSKGFEKFEDGAEQGQNIAMAAMGSRKKGTKKTMDMFPEENGSGGDDSNL